MSRPFKLCWLRGEDWEKLRAADVFVANDKGLSVSLLLGARARGESTKTGPQQGVRPDHPRVASILRERKRARNPGDRLFNISRERFNALWSEGLASLGIPYSPPHSIRHSGPSLDAYIGYRDLPQIRKRGRWVTAEAVARYSKSHVYVQALSVAPPEVLERGQKILEGRGPRPTKAPL